MSMIEILLSVLGGFLILPILAYMLAKFGRAGYLEASKKKKDGDYATKH
jgi:hypothetical protein